MSAPAETSPRFQPGSLVTARGREWVVLPSDPADPDLLLLRPLGGTDADAAGVYLPLERDDVRSASLALPDPRYPGDAVSASLLRDAARLGFRSAAGPLRCLGRIAVQPRPYQTVPLLMALRQDPVRLLIADDVGIGKTIEAALIARELLDRGEIRRMTVLCSAQLCEQWQDELNTKFHIDAEVVRPGTVRGLESRLQREGHDLTLHTLFEVCPFTVVSIDYIKGDHRRDDFVRTCPELVIVDEAHTAASPGGRGGGAQHQRHALVRELAADANRHLILATATPHSGDQDAFASLVGLLEPPLEQAVAGLDYGAGSEARQRLAQHFVQRRRADIQRYLDEETDFPERTSAEITYKLTPEYRSLLERVLGYAREVVKNAEGSSLFHQRVSWWAALALLRCVSSSPAAASEALRTRANRPADGNVEAANRIGSAMVMDTELADETAGDDTTPGADVALEEDTSERARLQRFARDADGLKGDADPKLAQVTKVVKGLLDDGFRPIVFCRYIATAKYVGAALSARLRSTTVVTLTGDLPPEDREEQAGALEHVDRAVLVATDCLSEGVNLQRAFNAVVHYDLAWNPTRHEQREGRVDRYGQPSPEVRTVLLYGQDNRVDGVVLEVLLRKAERIRKTLGVSVPVPVDTEKVLEAIFDRLFERPGTDFRQLELFVNEQEQKIEAALFESAEREKATRTVFAQYAMHPDEVRAELNQASSAIGTQEDVRRFVEDSFARLAHAAEKAAGDTLKLDLTRLPAGLRGRLTGFDGDLRVTFNSAGPKGAAYVERTHPLIEAISGYLLDTALDDPEGSAAARCGAMRTSSVNERTVVMLLRGRYVIRESHAGESRDVLGEETLFVAFRGTPAAPSWLPLDDAERLVREAQPVANIQSETARGWLTAIVSGLPVLQAELDAVGRRRSDELLDAHLRVRSAAGRGGARPSVDPKLPLDVLGLYVFMPPPVEAA